MRTMKLALVTFLAAVLAATTTLAGTATAAPTAAPLTAAPSVPQLVAVRAGHHPGFDRVVWEFRGGLPAHRSVTIVPELLSDGEGAPVRIAGRTLLEVTMRETNAHDMDTGVPTAPRRLVTKLPNVIEVVQSGDFEAVVTYGVGLSKRQSYRLYTLRSPSRVVLDIRTAFPRITHRVSYLNLPNYTAGRSPYTTTVERRLPASAPAAVALDHIFAGPTAAERRAGLRTVRSGARDFRSLSIVDGVARLRLVGGCSSGGSTFTIANLIRPTLKRFASVDYVKIYDPSGRTARPTGRSDSIPECLEP